MIQVKRFYGIDSCNKWLKENDCKIKVISGSLAIGPTGSSMDTEVLITYESSADIGEERSG